MHIINAKSTTVYFILDSTIKTSTSNPMKWKWCGFTIKMSTKFSILFYQQLASYLSCVVDQACCVTYSFIKPWHTSTLKRWTFVLEFQKLDGTYLCLKKRIYRVEKLSVIAELKFSIVKTFRRKNHFENIFHVTIKKINHIRELKKKNKNKSVYWQKMKPIINS